MVAIRWLSKTTITRSKRRRPPAWEPLKLLLVIGLHIVVGSTVVVVVVDGGSWLRLSVIWSQQSGMGEREAKQP